MNGYSDAGNSYAKCEGLIDELLYYFIRYRQCSSGGRKKTCSNLLCSWGYLSTSYITTHLSFNVWLQFSPSRLDDWWR